MNNPMLKNLLNLAAAIFFAMLLQSLFEFAAHRLYPLPEGINPQDKAAIAAAVAKLPVTAFLLVGFAWLLGSVAGGWVVARQIAFPHTILFLGILSGIRIASGVANMLMIPHPTWFWLVGILALGAGCWLFPLWNKNRLL